MLIFPIQTKLSCHLICISSQFVRVILISLRISSIIFYSEKHNLFKATLKNFKCESLYYPAHFSEIYCYKLQKGS